MLRVSLFGTAKARYRDQPVVGFSTRQHHRLFCYLLLNRQRIHQRERLADLFWNEYPKDTSLKYLRNTIWKLRKSLENVGANPDEFVTVGDKTITFVQSSAYWLDAQVFETKAKRYQNVPGQKLSLKSAADLEKTADLYIGDLLEGIYDDWCLYDRERLRLLYLDTLNRLVTYQTFNGHYYRAIAYCRRILNRDNTREKTHRRIMELFWRLGDRESALKQYDRCAEILQETLDVQPMRRTQQLYQRIKQGEPPPDANLNDANRAPSPTPDASPQVLITYALERMRQLQMTINKADDELQHIEHLIETAINRLTPQLPNEADNPDSEEAQHHQG